MFIPIMYYIILYSYKIVKTIFLSKCYNAKVSQAAIMNNPIELVVNTK